MSILFLTVPSCASGLDIGIVLDKSESIGNKNLRLVVSFLQNLIQEFNPAPQGDHFGFITFNSRANLVFNFANKEYHDKDALLMKIGTEPIKMRRFTRTDLALKMARDKLFTLTGGERPNKPSIMIVMTDGRPYGPDSHSWFNYNAFFVKMAKVFKVCGSISIYVYYKGEGTAVNNHFLRHHKKYSAPGSKKEPRKTFPFLEWPGGRVR